MKMWHALPAGVPVTRQDLEHEAELDFLRQQIEQQKREIERQKKLVSDYHFGMSQAYAYARVWQDKCGLAVDAMADIRRELVLALATPTSERGH